MAWQGYNVGSWSCCKAFTSQAWKNKGLHLKALLHRQALKPSQPPSAMVSVPPCAASEPFVPCSSQKWQIEAEIPLKLKKHKSVASVLSVDIISTVLKGTVEHTWDVSLGCSCKGAFRIHCLLLRVPFSSQSLHSRSFFVTQPQTIRR